MLSVLKKKTTLELCLLKYSSRSIWEKRVLPNVSVKFPEVQKSLFQKG
jgi:hypothetical protein